MKTNRLEAFSDGVLAIIITIMVLELRVPHGDTWAALEPLWPVFLSYVLSFIVLATFWNNHHHLFQGARQVDAAVLWANMLLLFLLSLVPFATAWMGENRFASGPVAAYGLLLLLAALSYQLLARILVARHGADSPLGRAIGRNWKGKITLLIYVVGVALSFSHPMLAFGIYWLTVLIWFLPERGIERELINTEGE